MIAVGRVSRITIEQRASILPCTPPRSPRFPPRFLPRFIPCGAYRKESYQALVNERDAALTIAESEAERVVKLRAMVDELSSLALEKVKQGDEKAAREALKEKKLTQELLSRVEERSLSNYRLASTIGTKMAASMTERDRMMQDATPGESVSPSASTATSSEPSISSTWQENLEEAKARVYQEQLKAEGAGLRAKARVDELVPKFTEVREKIKKQAADDLNEALERVRQSPKSPAESILDAHERLRASDRETMAEIRLVMEKKRKGEYVSNEEIDWAFQMMDKLI